MGQASNNTQTNHTGHWVATATQSGTYEFNTAGTFVDRNIDFNVPKAVETVSGAVSVTVPVTVGTKADGKYPFAGTATSTGSATANVSTKGFTDDTSYSGDVSVSGSVSGSMDAIGLSASGSGSVNITTVTVGTKSGNNYPVTGSATGTGTATALVTSDGYGKTGVETGSGDVSVSANVNATITAGSVSVGISGSSASPTVSVDSSSDNISVGTITTTKPSSGYYAAVHGVVSGVTPSADTLIKTEGYIGNASEITVDGSITGKSGSIHYLPITKATISKGTTSVSRLEETSIYEVTRGTYNIGEGYINGTDGDLAAATFKNSATSGKTYIDISETDDAPILISGDYLYIDQGYTDNLKISLARLVPDLEGYDMGGTGDMLAGKTLFDNDGNPVTGTIQTKTSSDLTASGATVTVPAGYYASDATKSVASGSIKSFAINESTQTNVNVTISSQQKADGTYVVSVPSLAGTVNRTEGYISGTTSSASDSNGGVVGKIAGSTTSKTDGTASASVNITNQLASGTYTSQPTDGYSYGIGVTASASTTKALVSASVGYVGTKVSASTDAANDNKSANVYILDSTSKVGTTDTPSGSTISSGSTLTIGKGYYPTDRTFKAQEAGSAIEHSGITGSLSTSITGSGYVAPTLDTTAPSAPYLTISGNGSMTTGNIFNGTATAETKYMKVYSGTYSIS